MSSSVRDTVHQHLPEALKHPPGSAGYHTLPTIVQATAAMPLCLERTKMPRKRKALVQSPEALAHAHLKALYSIQRGNDPLIVGQRCVAEACQFTNHINAARKHILQHKDKMKLKAGYGFVRIHSGTACHLQVLEFCKYWIVEACAHTM
jgi:hypothetical protein